MLGFDATGRLSIGQLPAALVSTTFLTATMAAMAKLRVSGTQTSALSGHATGISETRASMSPQSALSAKAEAMLRARVPGGVALKTIVATMARAKVSPGYLLFAKAAMASSGLSDIHMEGTTTGPRDPLLLNSGSEFIASYWKGRS